eukprot:COSAG02_NODE_3759_length_6273_cov_2.503401_4_plen_45_part_00
MCTRTSIASQFEIVSQTVSMIDVLLMSNPSLQHNRTQYLYSHNT